MSHWAAIRALGRRKHAACARGHGPQPAETLLQEAARQSGIDLVPVAGGQAALLDGGTAMFDADYQMILIRDDLDPAMAPFYAAHEYAHVWLHNAASHCTDADVDEGTAEEDLPLGVQRVEGYSLRERREREANVFAREFLLPGDRLRRWYLHDGLNATKIAERVGVSVRLVYHQLADALLLPDQYATGTGDEEVTAGESADMELDPSQAEAASVPGGPLLLEAGPGTGKTRTLVARVLHLLRRGVPPESILALTFSNKAAEEMRARVAAAAPDAAPRLWMGTFHAFGLELLRKYGATIDLADTFAVLDPVDALFLLEQSLPDLGLNHYQDLQQPARLLPSLLAAISRAKDELAGPEQCLERARQMHSAALRTQAEAATADEQAAARKALDEAERALEMARVYAYYQQRLEREHMLDFADLIFRAVTLLRDHPAVRAEIRRTYREILVDEYQDVNRASALLLHELAGDGHGLWVVGDARQSIYRFRGAAPSNMRLFCSDFPQAKTLTLRRNYRSQPAIVTAIAQAAPRLRVTQGQPFTPWDTQRTDGPGKIMARRCGDAREETAQLAAAIRRQYEQGVPYGEQAVLCRTHQTLQRMAEGLERAGIPTLYLGNLFARPEVRDLLAIVSLASGPDGTGLVRVAGFPDYEIPLDDVRTLLDAARSWGSSFPRALALVDEITPLSEWGQAGLRRLREHLQDASFGITPWELLARYLFERSGYLRHICGDQTPPAIQRRLAIYQFLHFAYEHRRRPLRSGGHDPKRIFLDDVQRMLAFGEERALRQMPEGAAGLDAVRLLTIHAAKGLEFRAVYLPALVSGVFPAPAHPSMVRLPDGILPDEHDMHDEEEECLFFVALSRARDLLYLSYHTVKNEKGHQATPSRFFALINSALPAAAQAQLSGHQKKKAAGQGKQPRQDGPQPGSATPGSPLPVFDAGALDCYLTCPRQYYYQHVLELRGRHDSAYRRFHRCIYSTLDWIQQEQMQGRRVDERAAADYLNGIWEEQGPSDHAFAGIYRARADEMVRRAARRAGCTQNRIERPTWPMSLRHGIVHVTPDQVEIGGDGNRQTVWIRRLRTSKPSASEKDKNIYALYAAAGEQAYPDAERHIQAVHMAGDHTQPIAPTPKMRQTRLERYDSAIEGIRQQRFDPQPDDRTCARCPFYIICPSPET